MPPIPLRLAFRLLCAPVVSLSLWTAPPATALGGPLDLEALARRITVSASRRSEAPTFEEARVRSAKASPGWAEFQSRHPTWDWLWWDAGGHAPQRATGKPIAVPGVGRVTGSNVEAAAWRSMDLLADVIRVPRRELRLRRTFLAKDTWLIGFFQEHRGMRVIGSEVELRLSRSGRIVAFGVVAFPDLSLENPGKPRDPAGVLASAQSNLPEAARPAASPSIGGPFVFPVPVEEGYEPRVAYQVTASDPSMTLPWMAWVDAADGELIERQALADFEDLTGTVTGTVHPSVLAPLVSREFIHQNVDITSLPADVTNTVTTDEAGHYAHDLVVGSTSAVVAAALDGPVIQVFNAGGPEAAYSMPEPGTFPAVHDVAWSDANSTLAERDAFHHVNLIFEHVADIDDALGAAPSFRDGFAKLTCSVNNSGTCNAYYSFLNHSLRFYQADFGCLNTAEIPRVVYHEWGHSRSFEQYRIAGANLFLGEGPSPSQLKEALADITTFFFFDQSTMPQLDGDGIERNADNDYEYPADYNGLGTAHNQSQILSGALWRMRANLIATHGAPAGKQLAEELFHVAQYGGADHSSSIAAWVEFLLDLLIADDDDADLSNGTPNFGDIASAFQAHGIWPTNLGAGADPSAAHAQVALVLDRSGSMGQGNPTRLARAKDAANAFTALMGDTDRLGVSNFDHGHEPALDHPLVQLTPGNRLSLQNLIDSFDEDGGATSIGLGLQHGQIVLDPGLNVQGAPPEQFILILSDGEENTPPWAMDEVALLPPTTRVYTVFLGSDAEGEALMQDLAAARDGVFLDSPNDEDLLRTYVDMYALIMEREMILGYTELINPIPQGPSGSGDTSTVSRSFCLEEPTREAQFLGSWTSPAPTSGFVELIDPLGVSVTAQTIRRYPGGSALGLPNAENLRIRGPRPGLWTMNVHVVGATAGNLEVRGFCVTDSDVKMKARGRRVAVDSLRQGHALQVDLIDARDNVVGEPILGASVTAAQGALLYTLLDDGSSFDGEAGDGRYGARVALSSDTASTVFDVRAAFSDSGLVCTRIRTVNILPTRGGTAVGEAAPPSLRLSSHPNPFAPRTHVRFDLARGGPVELSIYDSQGRKVRVLVRGHLPAGSHGFDWDGRAGDGSQAASGVYFVELATEGGSVTRKVSLVR